MLFRRKRKSDARVKKESAVRVEMKRVRGEPHGTHFRALHSDMDKLLNHVMGQVSLNNVFRMTQ